MNNEFIRVKALEGELKLSQVKRRLGCSVTTKEIILQKPYHSYQINFADILGIVPVKLKSQQMTFEYPLGEKVVVSLGSHYYKISANKIKVHNNSGIYERGQTELIFPLTDKFLQYISKYSNLTLIT